MAKRESNGRYDLEDNLDRLCVCGHKLADHSPEDGHECLAASLPENKGKPDCGCEHFKQSRKAA